MVHHLPSRSALDRPSQPISIMACRQIRPQYREDDLCPPNAPGFWQNGAIDSPISPTTARPGLSQNGAGLGFELRMVRAAPLAWGVFALGLGMFLQNILRLPVSIPAATALLAAAATWLAIRGRREWPAWGLAFIFAASLGAIRLGPADDPLPKNHIATLAGTSGAITIEGIVASAPAVYAASGTSRLLIDVESVQEPGRSGIQPARGCIRATLHWRAEDLAYGDRITLRGRLFSPSPPTNPGQSDYAAALRRRGIHVMLSVWNKRDLTRTARRQGHPVKHVLISLRHWATGQLIANVGSPEGEVLGSIVFGFHSGLAPELLESFRVTGLIHILVASGMNVGLLAWLCLTIFHALGLPRIRAATLTLPILVGFLLLCGADPPLTRATIMFGLLVGAQSFGRAPAPLNALGAAAILILIIEPLALWDRSFQFSYAATFGVMALTPWIVRHRGRIPRIIVEAGACTLAAQVALLPFLAATFATVPFLGALANLFVTPVIGIFLTGGLSLLLVGWIPLLGVALGSILKLSLGAVIIVVEAFATVPLASIVAPPFPPAALVAYAMWIGGGLLWLASSDTPRAWPRILCIAGAAGLGVLIWQAALTSPNGKELSITFLDVGQGSSVVIRLPSGRAILWDAGPPYAGRAVVAPYLRNAGIGRLAGAIISHLHSDHSGGMTTILQQFPLDILLLTGHGFNPTRSFSHLRRQLLSGNATSRLLWDGVELTGEPGVRMKFLHPPQGWTQGIPRSQMMDENSAVLAIEYGGTAAILTGDVKKHGEEMTRMALQKLPPERLLQVPHHGSIRSSSPEFLAAISPRHAVVSAGRRNRFGHPHPAVVIRYRDQGTRLWQTSRTGALVARSNGQRWSISSPATDGVPQKSSKNGP